MLKERYERIKNHICEHKVMYACGASFMIGAGFTCVVMRSNIAQRGMGGGNAQRGLTNTASQFFNNKSTINITTVIEREGRGHPGWPVRNLETKHVELSQKAMAEYFGIPEGILSGHLNGKFPDAHGLHFERVNLAEA